MSALDALAPLRRTPAVVLAASAVRGAVAALRRCRGSGTPVRAAPPAPGPARAIPLGLLGLTLLDPATVVCFAAPVLGGAGAGGGAPLGRALTGRWGRPVAARVCGAVITASAVRTAWPS
ncbi:hypothetical protein [Streptomyces sp. PsTaAH-124]|uniref:hypothetical protein n=1 Tax=Streptomyces sp. PsTaAH-124 TaxID=1157638 RepID=UPI0003700B76|nr:hypothetical protein [Streptomyces sp. PsTaAH-124]